MDNKAAAHVRLTERIYLKPADGHVWHTCDCEIEPGRLCNGRAFRLIRQGFEPHAVTHIVCNSCGNVRPLEDI